MGQENINISIKLNDETIEQLAMSKYLGAKIKKDG